MAGRENYFVVLGLDPRTTDPAVIEQRIKEKQIEWSRDAGTGVGRKASDANRYKAMLPDIRRVMSDRDARAAEAAAARQVLDAARQGRERALTEAMDVICASGTHTAEQLKRLQNQFSGDFPAAEIATRLAQRCPRAVTPGPGQPLETIARTDLTAHDRDIAVVGKKNLYEFLGAGCKTPAATLYAEADRQNREIIARNQNSAEATAAKNLCGLAMKLFNSDDGKRRYDCTLSVAVIDGMRDRIQLSVGHGRISRPALDKLIGQAASEGSDRDLALAYITQLAAKNGWFVDDGGPLPSADKPQCGVCGAIATSTTQQNCDVCGHPFAVPCFACQRPVRVGNAACPHCGAAVADAAIILELKRRAEAAITDGNWSLASELLDRILARRPSWPPATALREQIASRLTERSQTMADMLILVRERKLFAARDALAQARQRFGKDFGADAPGGDLAARIATGIGKADQACRVAAEAERAGRTEAAFDGYCRALDMAADHPDAVRSLARMPPPSPASLGVTVGPNGLTLTWPAVNTHGDLAYRLIGQAGHPPSSPSPGAVVTETVETSHTDTAVPIGQPWYYALYSLRAGVISASAARSGPHLRTAEVSGLRAEPGAGSVTLHWTPPPNCAGIVVRRQEGAIPRSHRDGTAASGDLRSLHDSGLTNGRTYGYRVAAQFTDPQDPRKRITTDGVGITARPTQPPAPIEDLSVTRDGTVATLRWTPPTDGVAQLRRADHPPTQALGRALPLDQAGDLGAPLPLLGPGQARLELDRAGACWITPLSVGDGIAVIGRAVVISTVEDVTALDCRASGNSIVLTWQWPSGVTAVRLCHRLDCFPTGPQDPKANATEIARAAYEHQQPWTLLVAEAKPHYLAIYAKAPDGVTWSAGVTRTVWFGHQPKIDYRVRVRRNWWRRIRSVELELRSKTLANARNLVLVIGRGHLPLSVDDGEIIARYSRVQFNAGLAPLAIPAHCWGQERYARLFFTSQDACQNILLRHGDKQEMRLG
jgi:hypothetical protein